MGEESSEGLAHSARSRPSGTRDMAQEAQDLAGAQISVILPVLNEAAHIRLCLERLIDQAPGTERIVVDGGSTDGSVAQAMTGAQVLTAPANRALQMHRGAQHAQRPWLLFLHVDTALPDRFVGELHAAERTGKRWGAFPLRILGNHPLLCILAWGATQRTRWRGIALGDQALFIRRTLYQEIGGFPYLPRMEDYALSLALRAAGEAPLLARYPVCTSGRRWDQAGFVRTWWHFRRCYWAYQRAFAKHSAMEPQAYERLAQFLPSFSDAPRDLNRGPHEIHSRG